MSKKVDAEIIVELSKLTVRALRALGNTGPEAREQACEFAGQAWAMLHEEHPDAAERMNGILHYLTGPRFAKADAESTSAGESATAPGGGPDGSGPETGTPVALTDVQSAATKPKSEDAADAESKATELPAGAPHPWLPAPETLQSETDVAAYYEEVGAKAEAGEDFDMEVRHLIPADRHTLIIDAFNKLSPKQGFVLVNDHDPKPLYYQFAFEYADRFTWDPLEEGPEVWRVRIGRR